MMFRLQDVRASLAAQPVAFTWPLPDGKVKGASYPRNQDLGGANMPLKDSSTPSPGEHPSPGPDNTRKRLLEIEQELAEIFYELVNRRRTRTGIDGKTPDSSQVKLDLHLDNPDIAKGPAPTSFLESQLGRRAEQIADRSAVFPSGKVYCHWCRSFDCAHSEPSTPRQAFAGYSPTGQPGWNEFTSILLQRGDPRIDLLHQSNPATLTLVQSGRELADDQLATYGKRSGVYRVLGQAAVGYLSAGKDSRRAENRYVLSLQAVQAGSGRGPISLNIIGQLPDGGSGLQAVEEFESPRLLDSIRKTSRHLSDIDVNSLPKRRRGREKQRRVLETLRRLSRNIERIYRQQTRRTQHSETRHRNKARPSSKALADALRAKESSIYRDVEKNTWIVLGPRNRVHIFNDAGLHITSVVYPPETVRHRTTRGKWMRPKADALDSFRKHIRDTGPGDGCEKPA